MIAPAPETANLGRAELPSFNLALLHLSYGQSRVSDLRRWLNKGDGKDTREEALEALRDIEACINKAGFDLAIWFEMLGAKAPTPNRNTPVEAVILMMKRRSRANTDSDLAGFLSRKQSAVAMWRKRGFVPEPALLEFERRLEAL